MTDKVRCSPGKHVYKDKRIAPNLVRRTCAQCFEYYDIQVRRGVAKRVTDDGVTEFYPALLEVRA